MVRFRRRMKYHLPLNLPFFNPRPAVLSHSRCCPSGFWVLLGCFGWLATSGELRGVVAAFSRTRAGRPLSSCGRYISQILIEFQFRSPPLHLPSSFFGSLFFSGTKPFPSDRSVLRFSPCSFTTCLRRGPAGPGGRWVYLLTAAACCCCCSG